MPNNGSGTQTDPIIVTCLVAFDYHSNVTLFMSPSMIDLSQFGPDNPNADNMAYISFRLQQLSNVPSPATFSTQSPQYGLNITRRNNSNNPLPFTLTRVSDTQLDVVDNDKGPKGNGVLYDYTLTVNYNNTTLTFDPIIKNRGN